jgi:hypothetical protein
MKPCVHLWSMYVWMLLRMREVLERSCRQNQNTRFILSNFYSVYLAVYEITWGKNGLLRFHCNSGYANAPQLYVTRTLPVLYISMWGLRFTGADCGMWQCAAGPMPTFVRNADTCARSCKVSHPRINRLSYKDWEHCPNQYYFWPVLGGWRFDSLPS